MKIKKVKESFEKISYLEKYKFSELGVGECLVFSELKSYAEARKVASYASVYARKNKVKFKTKQLEKTTIKVYRIS